MKCSTCRMLSLQLRETRCGNVGNAGQNFFALLLLSLKALNLELVALPRRVSRERDGYVEGTVGAVCGENTESLQLLI